MAGYLDENEKNDMRLIEEFMETIKSQQQAIEALERRV